MSSILIKLFILIASFSLFSGCLIVQNYTLTKPETVINENLEPTKSNEIEIFRSSNPKWEYKEIGSIVVEGRSPDMEKIFIALRQKAAEKGAMAIIDFQLEVESKTYKHMPQTTHQGANGMTFSVPRMTTTTYHYYTSTGTLITKQ